MRIGIDGRTLLMRPRGIARYLNRLLLNLLEIDQKNEYVLYINTAFKHNVSPDEYKNALDVFRKYPNIIFRDVRSNGTVFWEQIYLPVALKRDKIDIVHMVANRMPFLSPAKVVLTLHDVLELTFADSIFCLKDSRLDARGKFYVYRVKKYIHFLYKHVFKRAAQVITVSNHSKKDIVNMLGVPEERISVIYHGIDSSMKSDVTKENFIFLIGGEAEWKNTLNAVRGYALLPGELRLKHKLKIAGGINEAEIREEIKRLNIGGDVELVGWLSDDEMQTYFKKAIVFVFPSTYEGFGFPPLEAMAHGTPVVASNASCIPEITGNITLYFDPNNPQNLADNLKEVLLQEDLRNELQGKGFQRLRDFNWRKTAEKTLKVYEKVIEGE